MFMPVGGFCVPSEPFHGLLGLDGFLQVAGLAQPGRILVVRSILHADLQDVPADPEDHGDDDHDPFRSDERIDRTDVHQVAVPILEISGSHNMSPLAEDYWAGAGARPASTVTEMISFSSSITTACVW